MVEEEWVNEKASEKQWSNDMDHQKLNAACSFGIAASMPHGAYLASFCTCNFQMTLSVKFYKVFSTRCSWKIFRDW